MEKTINLLIDKMKFGKPVLFTGAGFSYGMKNIKSKQPKGVDDLSKLLMGGVDISSDDGVIPLKDIVDYYIESEKENQLIAALEDEFIINEVSDYHKEIAKINWKRAYTTNYDFGFELACNEVGKKLRTVNPLTDSEMFRDGNICVHINGDMGILSKKTLTKEFALSDISYVLNNFDDSYWFKLLVKDFESASAIVFVGYSLYDDMIKKILKSNESFKEKTFIITSPTAKEKDLFKLKIYGHVLSTGTEGFAKLIKDKYSDLVSDIIDNKPEHLIEVDDEYYENDDLEIEKLDIHNFFLFGKIDNRKIQKDYTQYLLGEKNYFIPRERVIDECIAKIKEKKNVIITGEIGNGKIVLLEQLISHLLKKEKVKIYTPGEQDEITPSKYLADFDKIINKNEFSVIICDDLNNNTSLISDFAMLQNKNLILIGSIRSIELDRTNFFGIDFDVINIDELSQAQYIEEVKSEVDYLIDLIDMLNFWGSERVTLSLESKRRLVEKNFNNQISELLLDLFSSENIINKIGEYTNEVMNNPSYKKILFFILLFKYLNIPINSNIIKSLSENNDVDSLKFSRNKSISLIYSNRNTNGFTEKSSIFCRVTLKYLFQNEYKIQLFLKTVEIVEREWTKNSNKVDFEIVNLKKNLIKEIMRFSNVDNLLKEMNGKKRSLFNYYDNLILKAGWLKKESHYWLQLAMAEIANDLLDPAQEKLNTAYKIARKKQEKKEYDTSSIDTQQARLYIKKALKEQHDAAIWSFFYRAHNLLQSSDNGKHRYRQVKEYEKIYNQKYSSLSKQNRLNFKECCVYMLAQAEHVNVEDYGEHSIRHCKDSLSQVLEKINSSSI